MTEDFGRYQPPSTPPGAAGAGSETDQQSSMQVAREQAGEVGQTAQHAGQQVAQTAVEQAREVASEAGRQARDLLGEARTQARDQAESQQRRAVDGLRALADELRGMVDKGGQSGVATEVVQTASERVQGFANWLDQRSPGGLVDEVRSFARRRPGTFLLGAALAGVVAGRLTRGIAAQQGGDNGQYRYAGSGPYAPGTGYGTTGGYDTGYRSGEYGGSGYRSGEYAGTGSHQADQYRTTGDYPATTPATGMGAEEYGAGQYQGSGAHRETELPGDTGPGRS